MRRQRSGACAKCSRSDALYIMKRRFMKMVVRITSSAGVPEARSCAEATIEAPANTRSDISIAIAGAMPLATIATPQITPKGATPVSTGSEARTPSAKTDRSNDIGTPDSTLELRYGCRRTATSAHSLLRSEHGEPRQDFGRGRAGDGAAVARGARRARRDLRFVLRCRRAGTEPGDLRARRRRPAFRRLPHAQPGAGDPGAGGVPGHPRRVRARHAHAPERACAKRARRYAAHARLRRLHRARARPAGLRPAEQANRCAP